LLATCASTGCVAPVLTRDTALANKTSALAAAAKAYRLVTAGAASEW